MTDSSFLRALPRRLLHFSERVLLAFWRNKGFLLASAVSYNALLSLVPLLAVLLTTLSVVFDEQRLVAIALTEFNLLVPGHSEFFARELESFLANRRVIGWVGGGVLLFFSSVAFRSLEDAMWVIFPRAHRERRLWMSAVIPYAFISVLGLGLLVLTGVATLLESASESQLVLLSKRWSVADVKGPVLYGLSFLGLAALFTAIYRFLPEVEVRLDRALLGGLTAACLWELARNILVWWFAKISLVDVVYGSLATVVVILLTLEAGAVILLLGAQVIAELERPRAAVRRQSSEA